MLQGILDPGAFPGIEAWLLTRSGLRMRALAIFPILCIALLAQGDAPPLKYEVASIKPADPNDKGGLFDIAPSGAVNLTTTVKFLLVVGYKVKDYQLVNEPKWLETDQYRIMARPPSGPVPSERALQQEQTSERIRNLLADRFQFKAHHETRTLPEYSLVVAKGGTKLKEIDHDAAMFRLLPSKGKIATRGGAKIAMLANLLENIVGYPVHDETGLDKYYDIQLTYWPEDQPDAGPSIFQALQEQMGLKLESRKGPIEVLVIDHVERPSEN